MILLIIGTRAELIKVFPIMRLLEKGGAEWEWIATGQHRLEPLIKKFKIKKPLFVCAQWKGERGILGGLTWFVKAFWSLLSKTPKSCIIAVHGDTLSTLLGSLAAKIRGRKLAHIEAGLRSGNLFEPFPEEIARRIADYLADVRFAPHEEAVSNLKGKAILTGNPIVDSLNTFAKEGKKKKENLIVATLHRQENIKSKKRMERFVEIINALPYKVIFIYKEGTKEAMEKAGLWDKIKAEKREEVEYSEFLENYLIPAKAVITDSGGISEECLIIGKPCLIYRENTEREEVIRRGIGKKVINASIEEIVEFIERPLPKTSHPYGKSPSQKIVKELMERCRHRRSFKNKKGV